MSDTNPEPTKTFEYEINSGVRHGIPAPFYSNNVQVITTHQEVMLLFGMGMPIQDGSTNPKAVISDHTCIVVTHDQARALAKVLTSAIPNEDQIKVMKAAFEASKHIIPLKP